jgi:CRP/FNR family transcriptional regulator, cyclic AMP receptor protein
MKKAAQDDFDLQAFLAKVGDQLFNSSAKRLARLLLLLANFGKDESQQPIKVRVSQETLAEMIGTTRS